MIVTNKIKGEIMKKTILIISLVAAVAVVFGAAAAVQSQTGRGDYDYNMGPGMMGSGSGYGMMGGNGKGYGYGPGMMGWGNDNYPYTYSRKKIEENQLKEIAQDYLQSTGDPDLSFTGYIEYGSGYAVGFKEKNTGIHAFEIYIDKGSEAVYLEMGPYMMWNTKYRHMGMMEGYSYNSAAQLPVSEKQAKNLAEEYVKASLPNAAVDNDVETFYGFYEFVLKMNNKPFSHLFINGYSGQYWYWNPHGHIIQIKSFK